MIFKYVQLNPVRHLKTRPRPLIRHCPVCGITMLASKSRENLANFDTFQCLSCHSVITESKPPLTVSDKNSR